MFSFLNPNDAWFNLSLCVWVHELLPRIYLTRWALIFGSGPLFPRPGLTHFEASSRRWPGSQFCPLLLNFLSRSYLHQQLEIHGDRSCIKVKGHINDIKVGSPRSHHNMTLYFIHFFSTFSAPYALFFILCWWPRNNRNISKNLNTTLEFQ